MVGSLGLGASGSVMICDMAAAKVIHTRSSSISLRRMHARTSIKIDAPRKEQQRVTLHYQRVEVVAAAGDADERRRGGGGGLEEAAVADVLGAVRDGHGDGGHEQVHHLADHPPHHQRFHEPGHLYSTISLCLLSFSYLAISVSVSESECVLRRLTDCRCRVN